MADDIRYFRARHIATMTAAGVTEDGCVAVDAKGWITAVGAMRDVDPPRIDEDIDGLLTPGLVNAHTHLELTHVPRPPAPGTFQDWLLMTMRSTYVADPVVFRERCEAAVKDGLAQCVKFGVTCVGDISQNVDIVRPILADAPIRSISYGECLGLGPRRGRFDELLRRAGDDLPVKDISRMMIGVSPHAPYTVDAAGYAESHVFLTDGLSRFWCSHVAETPDEAAFIRDQSGPFADLYRRLGFDPGPADGFVGSPVAWVNRQIDADRRDLFVHVNYCTDDDLDRLARFGATVAWCPRTHSYFGHPPHRWREMRDRGIPVCVATDSCASSPDLNVMDDLRLVRTQAPDVSPVVLWEMVTASAGVRGWPGTQTAGRLASTEFADLCAWPTRTNDPLAEVLDTAGMLPSGVWVGGQRI